ncbi:MAG: citramalate synthase [Candidatus Omnitrophica bacterium CG07_land_8_20_14_0_80_42_15]|uniref:Citramalate synthase n=1 Tax=Candidatus Aquitaenariimonas noxiae TaxID=1974741 RepID=A0A2J0L0Z8_9BACT|nr:MAG: citramalate synthase [Candidatus Omnitrophica bacterium CG07_land_8_20_14_0_80_42_15]
MHKIKLYDTTLRDGAQTRGVSLTVMDKFRIAKKLDQFGIHYIEGGWPFSNPRDIEFFKMIKKEKLKHSLIASFGSTRKVGTKASGDPNLQALINSQTPVVTIFGKTWDMHVTEVLRTSLEENLKMIEDSVRYLKSKGREVIYDAEHFFDGYINNPGYAMKTLYAAIEVGCDAVVLCDTNGGTVTLDVAKIVEEVLPKVKVSLGAHMHNDNGMAVANSIVAIQAGCDHIQGTINGLGERCGNADLISIVANLKLKLKVDCISDKSLKELTELSNFIADTCNMRQMDNQPFVGGSAFAHKGGVHINAVMKSPITYEHVMPGKVGNRRHLLISDLAGKSGIIQRAEELDIKLDKKDPKTKEIYALVQKLEHEGYHFEAAEASFELLMKRVMGKLKKFFDLEEFRVIVENREGKLISEATIKISVGNVKEHTAALGDGPVNALDNALRKALKGFYPRLSEMHLTDFKVRVLDEKSATAASVRVLIQSQDEDTSWWTIGVSENIIEASWLALVDSIEYKLMKDLKRK